MAKSAYEFWLSFNNGKQKLRLPVLPDALDIGNASNNESLDIAKLGELTVIQDPAAKTFEFTSSFPNKHSSMAEYSNFPSPWDCIQTIEKWKNSGDPIRFLVTKTPINMPVSIEDFTHREEGGAVGDLSYTLALKEYKYVTVRKITVKKPKPPKPRPNPKPKSKTHTVKKGDTLWDLARKYYGDSLKWRKIWNKNKTMMIKRDKRNIKMPGHWIFPNQRLIIP